MNYSVIIPTLDEVDNIDPLITRLLALLGLAQMRELIFVDDGSTDGTIERLRGWCGRAPIRLVQRHGPPDLTRAVCDGVIVGWPLHRRPLSRLAGLLAWPHCDLSDPIVMIGNDPARALFARPIAPGSLAEANPPT